MATADFIPIEVKIDQFGKSLKFPCASTVFLKQINIVYYCQLEF